MADRVAVMRQGRIVPMDRPGCCTTPPSIRSCLVLRRVNVFDAAVADARVIRWAAPALKPAPARSGAGPARAFSLAEDGAVAAECWPPSLGRVSLLHLRVEVPGLPPAHLHARLSCRSLPAEGSRLRLTVDPSQVFLYPTT